VQRNSARMTQRVVGALAALDKCESVLSVNHTAARRCDTGGAA
jgi:hypothetical protein